jgi:hypothetical protein
MCPLAEDQIAESGAAGVACSETLGGLRYGVLDGV